MLVVTTTTVHGTSQRPVFVERSSTIERYCQHLPPKKKLETIVSLASASALDPKIGNNCQPCNRQILVRVSKNGRACLIRTEKLRIVTWYMPVHFFQFVFHTFHTIFLKRLQFSNLQASLNHRANARSCLR
jgi:hypothetical protein